MSKNIKKAILLLFLTTSTANGVVDWRPEKARDISELKNFLAGLDTNNYQEFTRVSFTSTNRISQAIAERRDESIYYFPSNEYIHEYGANFVSFNEELDQLNFLRLISISPQGKIHAFSTDDLKFKDDNTYNTFSSYKHAVFAFPHLEAGSFAVLEYELIRDLSRDEADWYLELYPQKIYPGANFELHLEWKPNFPLSWRNSSPLVQCLEDAKRLSVTCRADQLPKIEFDYLVHWPDQLDHISIGQYTDWKQVAERAEGYFLQSRVGNISELDQHVRNLTDLYPAVEDKITAITKFVGQQIQYVSLAEHGNAMIPHPLMRTFNKRAGDCKDKSALLVAMLEQIGINAHPVLVATDRTNAESSPVPSLRVFDHMIVCFSFGENSYCVDPTDKDSDWRYISPFIQGRVSLPLFGENRLDHVPLNPYRWQADFVSDIVFDREGRQAEQQTRTYHHEYASVMRNSMIGMSKKEQSRNLLEDYKRTVSDQVNPEFQVQGLEDTSMDVTITSNANYKPFLKPGQDLNYIEDDAWLKKELDLYHIRNKIYEFPTVGLWIHSKVIWDLSQNWKIKAPPANLRLKHKYGTMVRDVQRLKSGKLEINTELKLPRRLIASSEIQGFNQFLDLLEKESRLNVTGWSLAESD